MKLCKMLTGEGGENSKFKSQKAFAGEGVFLNHRGTKTRSNTGENSLCFSVHPVSLWLKKLSGITQCTRVQSRLQYTRPTDGQAQQTFSSSNEIGIQRKAISCM